MKTIIEMAGKAFETPGIEPAFRNGFWTVTSEELERFAELVRADEREECAGLAERRMLTDGNKNQKIGHAHACKVIAEAIRARGNT